MTQPISLLRKVPFTEELLPNVQGFFCGDLFWEGEISDWIKDPEQGAREVREGQCDAWLYANQDGELVGFSSLGSSNWRWPTPKDPRISLNVIPALGVDKRFWGKPEGARADRYSAQILRDLIETARTHSTRQPLLALYVHPDNIRAIKAYENAGFKPFSKTYKAYSSQPDYVSRILNL